MTSRRGLFAAAGTIGLSLVLLLPLCNALFDCGCSWPWAGGSARCNIHSTSSHVHCPWCASPLSAGLSILPALAIGAAIAFRGDARSRASEAAALAAAAVPAAGRRPENLRSARADLLVRVLAGVGAFLVLASLGAWITAIATGYPRFLGG